MVGIHPEKLGLLPERVAIGIEPDWPPARKECVMGLIDHQFEDNFITTSIDRVLNWARESSIWPMGFGLACCAIEMMTASASRYDIARFGAEAAAGQDSEGRDRAPAGTGDAARRFDGNPRLGTGVIPNSEFGMGNSEFVHASQIPNS